MIPQVSPRNTMIGMAVSQKNNQKHKHQPHPTTKCVAVAIVFIAVAVAVAFAATAAAAVVVVVLVLVVLLVVLLLVVSHWVFSCKCQTATHISCENDTPEMAIFIGKIMKNPLEWGAPNTIFRLTHCDLP